MEIIHGTNIDFMGKRKLAMILSLLLVVASIVSLATRGLNLGLDFTGGTLIELEYPDAVELSDVRQALAEAGFGGATVQNLGSSRDVVVRLAPRGEESTAEMSTRVLAALVGSYGQEIELRRVEFVGPQIGKELTEKGGLAILYVLIGILIYVSVRFQWRFSVGAIVALVHDAILTLGAFSFFQFNFDLSVLAAILAVIGYSLNDTIVVYDRVRENFRLLRKGTPLEILNLSVNQMLSRTVITSLTTLLVLTSLYVFGGEMIHGFAIALIIGVIVGTYSSIFVAGTAALFLGVTRTDLLHKKKEEMVDDAP